MTTGHSGMRVRVQTNSFKITHLPYRNYHHYDVIIQRNVIDRKTGQKGDKVVAPGQRYTEIIERMQDMRDYQRIFNLRVSYDGLKNLYSPKLLEGATKFEVTLDRASFLVELRHVAVIDTSIFSRLTSGAGAQEAAGQPRPESALAVNLLQVLVSQAPHIHHNFSPHAKSFYSGQKQALRGGLVAISGIFQSVRPVLNSFIVNVDTTTAAFYQDGPLVDVAMIFLRKNNVRDLVAECSDPRQLEKLERHLKKLAIVVSKECGGGRKRYIKGLVAQAGLVEFRKGDDVITVNDHYFAAYNKQLQRPYLFGVKCEGDAVFPAEVCSVIKGQRYRKKLDPDQTSEFLKCSVKDPGPRLNAIQAAVSGDGRSGGLGYANSPYMRDAGMQVETTPMEIDARQLPPPVVKYGSGVGLSLRDPGAWNVKNQLLFRPQRIVNWVVVTFDPRAFNDVRGFVNVLSHNMRNLGMTVDIPADRVLIENGNVADPFRSLNNARLRAGQNLPENLRPHPSVQDYIDFILVILPENALPLRKLVKYWGDVSTSCRTQCIRAPKYRNANDQYCNNVALKINAKMGGVNCSVESQEIQQMLRKAMVVGCDVSHPGPGINNRPSLASVVFSTNSTCMKYRAYLDCQNPRQEMIENLAPMLQGAVTEVANRMGGLPDKLIVYRDGVSEGEYWKVMDAEVGAIKAMIASSFNNAIKLVFIVVGKRHHVRFFPPQGSPHRDRKGNCIPGLVVDTEIVHSVLPDFYLQSHSGLIGTSRPSHYVVLHNDPAWPVDNLQKLSFHLCYFYAVATRSVSIPAPVYYADRACTRATYLFNPDAQMPEYDSSTNEDGEFNLKLWRDAFAQSKSLSGMYFV